MIRTWIQAISMISLSIALTGISTRLKAQAPTPADPSAELEAPAELEHSAEMSALSDSSAHESSDGYVTDESVGAYMTDAGCGCDGGCTPWGYGAPALFYNFYVPNNCGGVPTALYIAPRPVPAVVGHTYYTYQPLMPHEFTYPHHRTYRSYSNDGRGMTRARVEWYCNPIAEILQYARQAVRIPR